MNRRPSLMAVAIATALGLTIAATAPPATAATISFDNIVDYSCGTQGKVSYATKAGSTGSAPVQRWLIDAYSDQGVTPVVKQFITGGFDWQERTITASDSLTAAGTVLTPAKRAQIGYLLSSRAQPAAPHDAVARYGVLWRAIGIVAGAPAPDVANCLAISDPATAIAAQVGGIPAGNTGQVSIVPQLSAYDAVRGVYLLTGIKLVDAGTGFDYSSLPAVSYTLPVTLTGASFDSATSKTSADLVVNQGVLEPVEIFVDKPGPITIDVTSLDTVPSTELHVLEADGVARQFVAAEQIQPAGATIARTAPTPVLSVTPTAVIDTTATLSVPVTPRFRTGLDTANLTVTSSAQTRTKTLALTAGSHTFTELNPNTTYTATYTRSDGYGGTASTTFTTGPVAPTGVRVTSTSTSAAVSWEPPPGATSYRVTVGDLERTVTSTSAQVSGLAPRTTYPVTVQAIGANPGATASTTVRTALAAPTGARSTSSTSTTAALVWNPVEGATDYLVQLAGIPRTWSTTSPTVTLTGLSAGRTYTATITATAPGEALSQATVTFATTPNTPPAVKITKRSPTTLTLAWTRGPAGSRYEVRVTGKGGKTVSTSSTSTTITGLTASSAYAVTVRTLVGSSASPWQTPIATSTTAKTAPKVTIKKTKKARKISVAKTAPGTKIRVQIRKGKTWRTVKTLKASKAGAAKVTVKTRAKVRVIVNASASTTKLVRTK
ncbi:hypothetical protein GCM10010401_08630 [Rarobacter faecitabidus]|uniref:Fibronectin type III domain protein n=1 Tax=Rarobacter faecitabidus TaxID=13243 RepID=A0A542ZAV9_RARFA|nr:fibronectin type III domain-containing protein [Rarobacter faecitabidus]TQL57464.1 fibronectin type III domain protein [Rarobacter faecitabidus]